MNRRLSLFQKWMLSYLLVILPLLALNFVLIYRNADQVRTQMQDAQTNSMAQIELQMDELIARMQSTVQQVNTNPDLQSVLRKSSDRMSLEDHFALIRFRSLFGVLIHDNPYISNIIVYLGGPKYFVESHHVLAFGERGAVSLEHIANMELDQVEELLNAWYDGEFFGIADDARSEPLYYLQSINIAPRGRATILLSIKPESLGRIMSFQYSTVGETVFATADGGELYSAGSSLYEREAWASLLHTEGVISQPTVLAEVRHLAKGKYVLIGMTSLEQANRELLISQAWTGGLMLLCLSICVAQGVYFAHRNYTPMKKVMALIDSMPALGKNEYTKLYAHMASIMEQCKMLEMRVDEEKAKQATREVVERLAQDMGRMWAEERLGVKPGEPSLICLIRTEPVDYPSGSVMDSKGTTANGERVTLLCGRVIDEWLGEDISIASFYLYDHVLSMLKLDPASKGRQELVEHRLKQALQLLRDECSIDCRCFISAAVDPGESWEGAVNALLRQIRELISSPDGLEPINRYEERSERAGYNAQLKKLHRAVRAGKYAQAARLSQKLAGMTGEAEQLADVVQDNPAHRIKTRIIDIVDREFANPNLNVTAIAGQLGMSPDALSRAFRQTTPIGILDYIHYVRIKAAKKWLTDEPSLPLREVFKLCGYANIDSFIRTFKRIEGITPGQYRDRNGA